MSILNYFEEYFKGNPLDDENIRKLLEENPEEFYHQGSEMFKQQIFEEKILKIMKLIFVQMYHIPMPAAATRSDRRVRRRR